MKYECDQCEEKFDSKLQRIEHLTSQHQVVLQCQRCQKDFLSRQEMLQHHCKLKRKKGQCRKVTKRILSLVIVKLSPKVIDTYLDLSSQI